jgi:hypothetical protein
MVKLRKRVKGNQNGEMDVDGVGLGPAIHSASSTALLDAPKPSSAKHGAEHLAKHRWQPGCESPNPGGKRKDGGIRMGSRNMMERVWAAVDKIESESGVDYVEQLLRDGMKSDSVRNTLLAKFLPSKIENVLTIDDVKASVSKIVSIVRKHVKDKATFAAIATEVSQIQLMPNDRGRVGINNAKAPRKKM